jgi:hypothetical protein
MPTPSATFTELVSTTFRKHHKEIKDNVSNNNAFLKVLMGKGMMEELDGGLSIVTSLDYNTNSTYQRYTGLDILDVSESDVITAAEYQWRQIALSVVSSGLQLRINSGDSQIIKLAKAKIKNAIRTFKNNFSYDAYSDGTLANQVNGLQALVADNGLGTVGGIDASTWAFWRNKVQSAAAPLQGGGAIVPAAATMESLMLPLWLALTRGDDKPGLIVADNNYFSFFEQSQTSIKRYTTSDEVSGGFMSLKYKGADVIFDGGSGIPANHMYFLNMDYMGCSVHKDANLTVLEEAKPFNQDGAVVPVLWMGNLTCSNRALQGVLKA